ncbi:MAG TPA: hypothetical protein VGV93_03370 [Acidimicrobiales bacterium]|nr:hypothetical protein [Acidimicrobiales bacterium]
MPKTKPVPVGQLRSAETYSISVGVTLRSRGDCILEAPPERALVASPRHTFADLALAIDDAFGRWELGRRRTFTLGDGTRVGDVVDGGRDGVVLDYRRIRLQRLQGGERFHYSVDDGERWTHECLLIGAIDPGEVVPDHPGHPVVYESVGRVPVRGRTSGTDRAPSDARLGLSERS